jgi:hypothetical protein
LTGGNIPNQNGSGKTLIESTIETIIDQPEERTVAKEFATAPPAKHMTADDGDSACRPDHEG